MESIDKLRDYSHLDDDKWTLETGEIIYMYGSEPNDPNAINWGEQWRKIAEEIEQEIADRFIELPVDADGVQIHVGDMLEYEEYVTHKIKESRVVALEYRVSTEDWIVNCSQWTNPYDTRHVKPRTIEDVLTDFANEVARQGHQIGLTGHELAMRYAAEIRELMGGVE